MALVRAKKNLGQHFLTDNNIACKIVDSLEASNVKDVLEIGPGMGVLTQFLIKRKEFQTTLIEIDTESVVYLKEHYPEMKDHIIEGDFLKLNLQDRITPEKCAIIGNFPYNISSQIYFKVIENRDQVEEVVGMIQKEVAERICSPEGNKVYGILSVFVQAFYDTEYLFTVHENVFNPPPRVKSAVLRLTRNNRKELGCDEKLFFRVVKSCFNVRRKTIKNGLKSVIPNVNDIQSDLLTKRPEQLSVDEFVLLTNCVSDVMK